MKTIPPPCPEPDSGPKYWRSLDQLADAPQFRQWVEREFPSGASEMTDPFTRRNFVKLMSASFLLAGFGLTGCRRPVEKIYPFSRMPEQYIHGVPKYYATSMPTRGTAVPLLAKSSDGRPTKLEGNPQHPDSNGGTDAFTQASLLNLYDIDRSQRYAKNGSGTTKEAAHDFLRGLGKQFEGISGGGLVFLSEQSSSPTRARLQGLISGKFPKSRWYTYEPVDFDIHRQAASLASGRQVAPYYKIDAAKVIVSLDCDFIGTEENAYINIRRFAKGRKLDTPADSMSRLYAVEPLMTLTGINADHRLRIPGSAVAQVAAVLLAQLAKAGAQVDASVASAAGKVDAASLKALAEQNKPTDAELLKKWTPDWITTWAVECAKDLAANKGASLVLAGHGQPLAVHLMAYAMNAALGNLGKTVIFHDAPEPKSGTIEDLAKSLNAGEVDTLVILGGNPSYNAPADLEWTKAVAKAKILVRLGYYNDESVPTSGWALPLAHFLESWGDALTADGTLVPVQPLIEPLFDGITEIEVLALLLDEKSTAPYDLVRETFKAKGGGGEEEWKKFLHDGFKANSAAAEVSAGLAGGAVASAIAAWRPAPVPSKDKLEVVFHRDASMDDGRFNNNGWLQEMPDPVTKMTWENVILMSRQTALSLGLRLMSDSPGFSQRFGFDKEDNRIHAPLVTIQLDGRSITGPAWIQPGQANNVIALALGYGREKTGRVGYKSGYNAYTLRTTKAMHIASGATFKDTGEFQSVSTTQDHGSMEGRPIIREASLKEYKKHPGFAQAFNMERPPAFESLYPNPFDEAKKTAHHQWGMSIDLNSCVGCSACMMACQSENNIPIVGKYQVANNREMHWIRIDRYFTGEAEDPQAVTQPMLCQHCEAAPCENVCPVNATAHDQEGLNVMVYNRCVGTRYCSNNCPYKVRRFNFFDYNRRTLEQLTGPVYPSPMTHSTEGELDLIRWWKDRDVSTRPTDEWELLKLVKNPDVTVRMRGVMEKCSYCLQRIEGAKIAMKVKARASDDVIVPDGMIKTACQQACPAEAIVFGNIADPESRVSRLKAQTRDYKVLDFLNTKPRTTYLARVRNPNPAMPDAYEMPLSSQEFEKKNGHPEEEGSGAEGRQEHHEKGAEKGAA